MTRDGRFFLPAVLLFALAGCASEEAGDPHPVDRLDFPVAVTADPSGDVVWVTSGNFDLAYRGGAVLAIDVHTNAFIPAAAFEVSVTTGHIRWGMSWNWLSSTILGSTRMSLSSSGRFM